MTKCWAEADKISYLDGLRGIAALLVFIFHFIKIFYAAISDGKVEYSHLPFGVDLALYDSPFFFLCNGYFSVCIFFVLSGYVLTRAYFTKQDKLILIKRAIARYPRLMIPSAISTLFVVPFLYLNMYREQGVIQLFQNQDFVKILLERYLFYDLVWQSI
ncbi:acyltransferase family protein [Aetokthonos hydrillicola Thurmond2011]|jgi:peptidoglycan/LPS O-acetylase OafA/YrhL|uniref:Acyltransferase family protein n=1 Tax=Aetokthonos hydrillicola Thurmond2011 TaxID=2712845 RepID=A0AAP5IFF0_9CYAN|nr:acyltransferase family protein [Aetokthonos hydrillicola]MBW4590021.1 acyltransferase family protein [Aetokthonos hydrillicola CCALA 1050]MDR9900601.1 acyltransferase family protein [Aetokthonos hydrillicola Thurmond2011]